MEKFALIKLLLVGTIIRILFTLLMPSLSRAREKAKIAVCLSNQRPMATNSECGYVNFSANGEMALVQSITALILSYFGIFLTATSFTVF